MIWATGIPSACDSSRTVTPDGTVTGPVGATISRGCFVGAMPRCSRERRSSWRGRAAPVSITTRRLRPEIPPWRGRIGRLGLLGPSAIVFSVEGRQSRIDAHGAAQHTCERPSRGGALEACKPPARVRPAPRPVPSGPERAVRRNEAQELRLRRLAAAAHAGADGSGAHCAAGSASSATGRRRLGRGARQLSRTGRALLGRRHTRDRHRPAARRTGSTPLRHRLGSSAAARPLGALSASLLSPPPLPPQARPRRAGRSARPAPRRRPRAWRAPGGRARRRSGSPGAPRSGSACRSRGSRRSGR